jgi:hypothetical protein
LFDTDVENDASITVPGKMQPSNYFYFSWAYRARKFSASLPAGTFTAKFVDSAGNEVWPAYVEELWEAAPDCAMYAGPIDVTLLKPEVACNELIRNGGNGTLTTSEPWLHTDPGVEVGTGLGINGGDAIITSKPGRYWTGLAQNLDSRCVDRLRGSYVEFSAWVRLVNNDGSDATGIDPDGGRHPQLNLNLKQHRDVATKEYIYQSTIGNEAQLTRPYKSSEFNLVHGIFRLPPAPHLYIEIDNAPDNLKYRIDDVSMIPFICNKDELVRNGDLELEMTKYWDTWGNPKLDIVPGYGGTGNALMASARNRPYHSMAQAISLDCGFKGKLQYSLFEENCSSLEASTNTFTNALQLATDCCSAPASSFKQEECRRRAISIHGMAQ